MSALSKELDRYLSIRRSLGYELGTAERILRRFIAFAEQQGVDHISTALFLLAKRVRTGEPANLGRTPANGSALCPMAARD